MAVAFARQAIFDSQ